MATELKELLAAILRDFDRAAVVADANRAHLRQQYADSDLLAEETPSRIRISQAEISLPIAIEDVTSGGTRDYGLTSVQILELLPASLSRAQRARIAETARVRLMQREAHSILSPRLAENLREVLGEMTSDGTGEGTESREVAEGVDWDRLQRFQLDFLAQPDQDRTVRVKYKTADLEQVDPAILIRLNIRLEVD